MKLQTKWFYKIQSDTARRIVFCHIQFDKLLLQPMYIQWILSIILHMQKIFTSTYKWEVGFLLSSFILFLGKMNEWKTAKSEREKKRHRLTAQCNNEKLFLCQLDECEIVSCVFPHIPTFFFFCFFLVHLVCSWFRDFGSNSDSSKRLRATTGTASAVSKSNRAICTIQEAERKKLKREISRGPTKWFKCNGVIVYGVLRSVYYHQRPCIEILENMRL